MVNDIVFPYLKVSVVGCIIVHEKSAPATESEVVGLSSLPPTQEDVIPGYLEVVGPTQTLTGATVIEFSAGSGAYATDLSASFVEVEFSVSTIAGSVVAATVCPPVNLSINATAVAAGHRYYAHSAMMLMLLGQNGSWVDSGELEGFYKDTAGIMGDHAEANTGFVLRKALITDAAVEDAAPVVSMAFRPYLGTFQQTKIIPDRTRLTLRLERASDDFAIINNNVAGSAIMTTCARRQKKRVELAEGASGALSKLLLREHALYSIDRVRCHQQTFRSATFDFEQILRSAIPTHVVVGFVSSGAAQGAATLNPFHFQKFGLRKLQIRAAGHSFPRQEYIPRFNEN